MNKIYKVVWSKVKNCYVVVSEIAKNIITGGVKSAKVGAAPMAKGLALGAAMAFVITGNAWAETTTTYNESVVASVAGSGTDVKVVTGDNVVINGTSGKAAVQATNQYAADSSGNATVYLGEDTTQSINIKSDWVGISSSYNGSLVEVKGQNLTITDDTGSYCYGISVINGHVEDTNPDNNAKVSIGADTKTTIDLYKMVDGVKVADGIGIAAMSAGIVDIKGDLNVNAKYAIATRGNATTSINGENVVLNGDINYSEGYAGDVINAEVLLNLKGSNSALNGNIYAKNAALEILSVADMKTRVTDGTTLILSDGATWNTDAASFVHDLDVDNGNISVKNAQKGSVTIGNLTGGAVNVKVDQAVGETIAVGTKGADVKVNLSVGDAGDLGVDVKQGVQKLYDVAVDNNGETVVDKINSVDKFDVKAALTVADDGKVTSTIKPGDEFVIEAGKTVIDGTVRLGATDVNGFTVKDMGGHNMMYVYNAEKGLVYSVDAANGNISTQGSIAAGAKYDADDKLIGYGFMANGNGAVVDGTLTVTGNQQINGVLDVNGGIKTAGDVVANAAGEQVSLKETAAALEGKADAADVTELERKTQKIDFTGGETTIDVSEAGFEVKGAGNDSFNVYSVGDKTMIYAHNGSERTFTVDAETGNVAAKGSVSVGGGNITLTEKGEVIAGRVSATDDVTADGGKVSLKETAAALEGKADATDVTELERKTQKIDFTGGETTIDVSEAGFEVKGAGNDSFNVYSVGDKTMIYAHNGSERTFTVDAETGNVAAKGSVSVGNGNITLTAEGEVIAGRVSATDDVTADNGKVSLKETAQKVENLAGNVYSKTEIDSALSLKADKAYVDENFARKDDVYTKDQVYNKTEIDEKLTGVNGALEGKADKADTLEGYGITDAYTKTEVDTALDGKADKADTLEGYGITDAYTKTEVDEKVSKNAEAISGLNQRLGKMNGKINKVGAGAAALAALHPLEYDPDDKLTFSAGIGNYAGETAAALGAFYRPDEKLMFSLGGTMGNGENMVNLGVSIGLDGAKGAPKLSRKELVEKVSTMEAENQAIKAENENIKAEVAELKALVAKLVAKK